MPETPSFPSEREQRLERILADYLHAVEAGEPPDRQELLSRHPDLVDELRLFFRNRDALNRLARPLQEQGPPLPRTGDPEGPTTDGVAATVRYFGDYEILEEVARGGMGVVYRARQVSLNRVVALKMILKGELATEADVRRFRAEAEAAGNLDHPNIVPIYEVGEHQGQHYFSMKFIDGPNLGARVAEFVSRPGDTARLLAIVARAVHHAHQHGILHRDLKPGNVLLSDRRASILACPGDGGQAGCLPHVPHVTDFGLARQLERPGDTVSGTIVGTPSYMAPEQARGSRGLTVAADVYSLGAILYELLAGRPAFRGPTAYDVLMQVIDREPERPPADADLVAICFKCLSKEPERRYESAAALADDLDRWLAGEPIAARLVGRLERARLWARRNPALAAMTSAAGLSLLLGLVVSTSFALIASHQAEQARKNETIATANERTAREAADRLMTAAARGLLRPLVIRDGTKGNVFRLSDPEIEALTELAAAPEEELRLRFLSEALRGPVTTRQLRDRRALALQAAIGLDPQRRAQAERLLGERLRSGTLNPDQQEDVALVLAELGVQDVETARAATRILAQPVGRLGDYGAVGEWAEGLAVMASRLGRTDPGEAAILVSGAMAPMSSPAALGRTLAELAPRVGAKEAGLAADALLPGFRYTELRGREHLASLSALVGRLEPEQLRTLAAAILRRMEETTEFEPLGSLAEALGVTAARLDRKEAATVCGQAVGLLARAMTRRKEVTVNDEPPLAYGLEALAPRLGPGELALFLRFLDRIYRAEGYQGIWEFGAQFGPDEARATVKPLLSAMGETTDATRLHKLARLLAGVAGRLDPVEAAGTCAQGAQRLAEAIGRTSNSSDYSKLALGLAVLLKRMEPEQVARVSVAAETALIHYLSGRTEVDSQKVIPGLAALMSKRAPRAAATTLTEMLGKTRDYYVAFRLLDTAALLDADEAVEVLLRALETRANTVAQRELSRGLAGYLPRLGPEAATAVCDRAAAVLLRDIRDGTDDFGLEALAQGLSKLAGRLTPRSAGEAALVLAGKARARENSRDTAWWLCDALKAVAPRLSPDDARATAAILVPAVLEMKSNDIRGSLDSFVLGLTAVAARLDPKDAAAAAGPLVRSLEDDARDYGGWQHAIALNAVATAMEPAEGAELLLRLMSRERNHTLLRELAPGLGAAAARLDRGRAAGVCRRAVAVLKRVIDSTSPSEVGTCAEALPAVVAGLPPGEAAEVCGRAALKLSYSLARTTERSQGVALPRGIAAVAPWLDRTTAAKAADALLQATNWFEKVEFGTGSDLVAISDALAAVAARLEPAEGAAVLLHALARRIDRGLTGVPELMDGLSAVLAGSTGSDRKVRAAAVAATVGLVSVERLPVAGAVLRDALPRPCVLSTPQLVELLKHPLCVDSPRRLILDQLGQRYGRPFADQWEFVPFAQERELGLDFTSPVIPSR
jgi:predicted Ser/Thr protein kinase